MLFPSLVAVAVDVAVVVVVVAAQSTTISKAPEIHLVLMTGNIANKKLLHPVLFITHQGTEPLRI